MFGEYVPKFRHFGALVAGDVILAIFAELSREYWLVGIAVILYAFAAGLLVVSLYWLRLLFVEAAHRRSIEQEDTARHNLDALTRNNESWSWLPPAQHLQAVHKVNAELGFDEIIIPTEGVQTAEKDGWNIAHEIPGGLATDEQYHRLAQDYFSKTHALPVRYYTESTGNPIFGRKQFERILSAIVTGRLGEKNPINGEVSLNAAGETWLRRYETER